MDTDGQTENKSSICQNVSDTIVKNFQVSSHISVISQQYIGLSLITSMAFGVNTTQEWYSVHLVLL